ncbi:hypothetical protein [Vibrio gangliei]|uniref:hypothetical protein n=1 Tax=Vibrio gangliei TaxID=2077090 RepID=UPI000D0151C6|nr:hypothetical protein [Vibrio gangliei]
MQTQNVTEELQRVLSTLQAEGKEPTVALVKARLSIPVPMPAIITTIKSWKASHRVPNVEVAAQETLRSAEERIVELEKQVQALTARLELLERK